MRAHRGTTMYLAFLLAGALSASCQDSLHAGERYVFVASNIDLPYWHEAQAGFNDAAQTMGVRADFIGPTTYSPEEELKTFRNAAETHPTGLLIAPARALLFKEMIDSAVQAGIPVICVDSDSPESRRILFIGTDNFRAGVESGNRMANVLHGRGRVALITILAQLNLNDRLRGVQETLKRHPEIEIAEVIDDKGEAKQAEAQVSPLLEARKIDGVLCLEASGGSGAADHRWRNCSRSKRRPEKFSQRRATGLVNCARKGAKRYRCLRCLGDSASRTDRILGGAAKISF